MNEEERSYVELEEIPVTDVDEVESENTDVQPESNSGGSDFLAKVIIGGACIGGGTVVYLGVKGVKRLFKWGKGKLDMRKVKPDKDGCVAEAEAEDVDDPESTEEPEQEENVQSKSRKKK